MKRFILAGMLMALLPAPVFADPLGSPNTFPLWHDAPRLPPHRHESICLQFTQTAEERIAACRADADAHPSDVDAWQGLGRAYEDNGDHASAVGAYTQAINHGDDLVLKDRALTYFALGDYDQAMADATTFIARMHQNAQSLGLRCRLAAMADRDREAALADCDAALKAQKRYPNALNDRLLLLYRLGRKSEALAAADTAVQSGHAPLSLYLRGLLKKESGDPAGDAEIAAATARDPHVADQLAHYQPNRAEPLPMDDGETGDSQQK